MRTALYLQAAASLAMGTSIGLTIFVPLYFEVVHKLSATESGLALIPLALTTPGSLLSGQAMLYWRHYKLAPIVGAFVAGLALSRSDQRERIQRDLAPVGHLFIPVFFLGIGIEVKELIPNENPTRNFDNIALRIRSLAPDIVMMSNYQNEYVLLARTLYQQKVNLAGMFSVLGGGFNYKFAKEQPEVSQYMMDTNHWYNPKSAQAQALKKRVEAAGKEFTFEVYLAYTVVGLLADSLERAGSADKEKLTAALASSTYKAEIMPYGPTKFVNGQNEGAKAAVLQANKGDIMVIAPEEFAEMKPVFPKPKFN